MRVLKFITGHMVYNLAYTEILQTKETPKCSKDGINSNHQLCGMTAMQKYNNWETTSPQIIIMPPRLVEKLPVFPVIRCTFSPFFCAAFIYYVVWCLCFAIWKKAWKITRNESKGRKNWNQEINNMNRCITNDKQHEITSYSDFYVCL